MKYIYAALLLYEAGKEINEENLKRVIEATGTEVDMARIKSLTASLKNVNIEEVINSAMSTPIAAPAAPAPTQVEEEKPKEVEEEKKKEEEEKKEEEALEGLGALFG